MKVRIKKLNESAVIPHKAHATDADDFDIIETLYIGKRKFYKCRCKKCGIEKVIRSDYIKKTKCHNCNFRRDTIPMTGKKFGKLLVIEYAGRKKGRIMWKCICDCGKEIICNGANLRLGQKSCGCVRKELEPYKKHGWRNTRVYSIWAGMKKRCYNQKAVGYANYGGRGIKMCKEWENSPSNFCQWAIENGYKDNLTIERKNNDMDYCPSNCVWIPRKEQPLNQRTNIVFFQGDERYILSEIARKHNIKYALLYQHYLRKKEINNYLKSKGIYDRYEQTCG